MKRRQQAATFTVDPEAIKRLQQATAITVDPEAIKRLQAAATITVDPEAIKRLQEAAAITVDPEAIKRLQAAATITVDPEALDCAHASMAVPLGQLRGLTNVAAYELDPSASEPVALFGNALADSEGSDADLVSDWVGYLGTTRQRRLLLLGLGALVAVLDAIDAEADVELPGHLTLVVYALIAIAILLNDAIDRAKD